MTYGSRATANITWEITNAYAVITTSTNGGPYITNWRIFNGRISRISVLTVVLLIVECRSVAVLRDESILRHRGVVTLQSLLDALVLVVVAHRSRMSVARAALALVLAALPAETTQRK